LGVTALVTDVAFDRFAGEIVGLLKVIGGALAATECQDVEPLSIVAALDRISVYVDSCFPSYYFRTLCAFVVA
jgi:hypothetical protein